MGRNPIVVLLIEDNSDDVAFIQAILEQADELDFDVECVNSLASANEGLKSQAFDVILLDRNVADCDDLATFLRNRAAETAAGLRPVVMLDGVHDSSPTVHFVQAGTSDCVVTQQADRHPLLNALQGAIERSRLLDTLFKHDAELFHLCRIRSMGELVASIVHEMKHPLGVIANYTGTVIALLQDKSLNPEQLSIAMANIEHQVDRASQIINNLERFVSKDCTSQRSSVSINRVIQYVERLLYEDAVKRNVQLQLHLDEDLPEIEANEIQIQQVCVNLLLNAFDAVEDAETGERLVEVRTSIEGDNVVVSVSDNGIGLSGERLEDIFEGYCSTKPRGMGLGLTISRAIVAAHGGQLWAEPNPRGGAIFRLSLPIQTG